MSGISCNCTDPRPFPEPYATISLTNYIEFIKVNQLYNPTTNHGEIVRQTIPPKRIKEVVSAYSIFESTYDAYLATPQMQQNGSITSEPTPTGGIRLVPVTFTDLIQPKSVYFFINKSIDKPRPILEARCSEIWRARYGAVVQGSVYFPPTIIKPPYEMPSRGVIFR